MNLLAQNLDNVAASAGVAIMTFNTGGLPFIFSRVLPFVFFGSAILLLIYMLTGGLQLMTSRGDPKGVAMAWAKITNALIGFIIVFLAYFLTSLFAQIFGLSGFGGVFK